MTYEEALEYEQKLHRRYFEPFEKLLERKAEYYLEKTETTGKPYQLLLEEIEVLERFREYVVMLENIAQEQLSQQFKLVELSEFWRKKWLEEIQWNVAQTELLQLFINQVEQAKHLR